MLTDAPRDADISRILHHLRHLFGWASIIDLFFGLSVGRRAIVHLAMFVRRYDLRAHDRLN